MLPQQWMPPSHDHGDVKVDVSTVGPWMTHMAGAVADGVHVHPHTPFITSTSSCFPQLLRVQRVQIVTRVKLIY